MALPYHKRQKLPLKKVVDKEAIYSKYTQRGMQLCDPDPVCYRNDMFKPCTMAKVIDICKRNTDSFMATYDDVPYNVVQRGIVMHTDRNFLISSKYAIKTQNDRLAAEENFVRKAKFLKRLSERKILNNNNQELILEGENLIPKTNKEVLPKMDLKSLEERKKQISELFEESISIKPHFPTMIQTSLSEDFGTDQISVSHPVSMDVYQIKLRNRDGLMSDDRASAPNDMYSSQYPMKPNDEIGHPKLPPISTGRGGSDGTIPEYQNSKYQAENNATNKLRIDRYIMDGVSVKFTERNDIQSEIKYLKSLLLPKVAKDLYVGRGIQLPRGHAVNYPRTLIKRKVITPKFDKRAFRLDADGGGSITIHPASPRIAAEHDNEIKNVNKPEEPMADDDPKIQKQQSEIENVDKPEEEEPMADDDPEIQNIQNVDNAEEEKKEEEPIRDDDDVPEIQNELSEIERRIDNTEEPINDDVPENQNMLSEIENVVDKPEEEEEEAMADDDPEIQKIQSEIENVDKPEEEEAMADDNPEIQNIQNEQNVEDPQASNDKSDEKDEEIENEAEEMQESAEANAEELNE